MKTIKKKDVMVEVDVTCSLIENGQSEEVVFKTVAESININRVQKVSLSLINEKEIITPSKIHNFNINFDLDRVYDNYDGTFDVFINVKTIVSFEISEDEIWKLDQLYFINVITTLIINNEELKTLETHHWEIEIMNIKDIENLVLS